MPHTPYRDDHADDDGTDWRRAWAACDRAAMRWWAGRLLYWFGTVFIATGSVALSFLVASMLIELTRVEMGGAGIIMALVGAVCLGTGLWLHGRLTELLAAPTDKPKSAV